MDATAENALAQSVLADRAVARGYQAVHVAEYYAWADLLERTFQIDVLACPGCGGRLRLIATIGHRAVIDKILRYLGLPGETVEPAPPRHPPWLPGFEAPTDSATEWPD